MQSRLRPFALVIFSLVLVLLSSASLHAATRTWTGTNSGSWLDPGNWGGTPIAPGDDLVFPSGALNLSNTNDTSGGTAFNSITISGPGYTLAGNDIVLGAGGITSSAGGTINIPFTLGASQQWSVTTGTLTLSGTTALNGFTLTLSSAGAAIGSVTGVISGAGAITKTGTGDFTLAGANTFTGLVSANAGRLIASNALALGTGDNTPANGLTVNAGGTFVFNNITLVSEHITVFGTGNSGNGVLQSNGTSAQNGTTVLGDSAVAFNILTPSSLTFNGQVTGAGRFGLGGDGVIAVANAANDFAGVVQWGATGGSINTLTLAGNNAIPASKSLAPPAGAIFNVNSFTQTIASLTGAGNTNLGSGGGGTLTLSNPNGVYSGSITGIGTMIVAGGPWTMTGVSTWSGSMSHTGGTLTLNGGSITTANLNQSNGTLTLSGATLGGAVTINGGTIAPFMIANSSGNLTLGAASTYLETISGSAAGQFGRINVTGAVNLGGAAFSLAASGTPYPGGTTFTIIDNDAADAVTGTFAGLAQGATIASGGQSFTISYTGGTGNDVVLTAQAITTPTTTTLASSANPSASGQNVTFTATVTPPAATGTVSFFDGVVLLGTSPLVVGTATFSTSTLSAASHSITAQYSGDLVFGPSTSAPLVQVVNALPPGAIPMLDGRALVALAVLLAAVAIVAIRN